jgi:hypothetical protein
MNKNVKIRRTAGALTIGALALIVALAGWLHARADEDEEKPITSNVAQVFRNSSGHTVVAIRPAAQKEIGLTTQVLKGVMRPVEVEAYGFVLDPENLAALNSKIVSAQAVLDAAAAQYHRTSRLYAEQKNASLRDLQTAQASYVSAQSLLQALDQQLRNEWGGTIAQMNPQARSNLISALVDHRQAIARVTAPSGEVVDELPASAEVSVLGHERQPLKAQAVYNAPAVIPSVQGQPFLLLIATGKFPVRPGAAVSAYLPISNSVAHGVMVPRSAVLRYAGTDWVYREIGRSQFERTAITPVQFTDAGYFVIKDLSPGMRIVIMGAQTLLSEELKSEIQIQD